MVLGRVVTYAAAKEEKNEALERKKGWKRIKKADRLDIQGKMGHASY